MRVKSDFKDGQRVEGYILEYFLGSGQDGEVWKAKQIRINKTCTLKFLKEIDSKETVERFNREIRLLSKVQHPNLLCILDSGEAWNPTTGEVVPFYAMEFLEGFPLKNAFKLIRQDELVHKFILFFLQISSALIELRKKRIIHGDIKSSNIIIVPQYNIAKLVDFGFGYSYGTKKPERSLFVASSYRLPEQIRAGESDIYQVGMTFRDCLMDIRGNIEEKDSSILYLLIDSLIKQPQETTLVRVCNLLETARNQQDLFESLSAFFEILKLRPILFGATRSRVLATIRRKKKESKREKRKVDVCIVTILENEFQAAKIVFGIDNRIEDRNFKGNRFFNCVLKRKEPLKDLSIIITKASKTNISCAIACMQIMEAYNVRVSILVGIAAGLRGKVQLGDVVAADTLIYYEQQVVGTGQIKKRPSSFAVSAAISQGLSLFNPRRTDWDSTFHAVLRKTRKTDPNQLPKVPLLEIKPMFHRGVILSGEQKIENGSLDKIKDEFHEQVRAIEMEGAGFCMACEANKTPWLIFRGICDFGDPEINKDWQFLSALAASSLTREFLLYDYRKEEEIES